MKMPGEPPRSPGISRQRSGSALRDGYSVAIADLSDRRGVRLVELAHRGDVAVSAVLRDGAGRAIGELIDVGAVGSGVLAAERVRTCAMTLPHRPAWVAPMATAHP